MNRADQIRGYRCPKGPRPWSKGAVALAMAIALVLMTRPVAALVHVDTTHDDFYDDGKAERFDRTVVQGDDVRLSTVEGLWDQTDWSDGPGKTIWNNDYGYGFGDGIEYNTSGSVALWDRPGHWTEKGPLSYDGIWLRAEWIGDRFIITGGLGGTGNSSATHEYFLETDSWNALASMPSWRYRHSTAWTGSDLFVMGGDGGMSSLLRYNRTLNTWSALPDAPINRTAHTMVFDGADKLLVFGGKDLAGKEVASLWSYNISSGTWVNTSMAPKPMSMHKAVWNDEDKVMIVTGGKSGQNYLWDTWAFDPSTALWTERAHMPSSWVDHSMVWYREEKRAFVFGGMAASEYNDALYIYDYDVDKWVLGVKGPEARYGHAAAWGDGRMAVFCGDDSSDYLNETWVYDYYMNRTTGWLVSSQVDLGRNVDFIGLDWQADVPNETWIGFQLATNKDHLTWDFLGPDGTTGTQFNASMKAIPDVHDGNRYFSYKVSMSSQNRTRTPGLTSFSLTYRYYETPGLFVSSVIDLLSDGPIVHSIGWDTIEPDGTDIRMTVTSGPNPDLSSPTLENMSIANGDGIPENVSRYLVYTAKLTTLNASLTPVLQEVRINYTPIPALSSGIVDKASGIEGEMFNFTVIYTDLAERPPTVAQVVIDGTPFDLATAASSFSTGASFLYGTTLATGMHNYYFNFKVGDIVLRFPDSGTLPGPNVKALNQGPKAVITLPREGDTFQFGDNIVLNGENSYDPDGDTLVFRWESGLEGLLSDEAFAMRSLKEGEHIITLTVTDPAGASDVARVNITVLHQITNIAPVPVISNEDLIKRRGEIVTVDASHSYDIDGTIVEWSFDWGDSSTPDVQKSGVGNHVYNKTGNYTVIVTVKDNSGISNTTFVQVMIKDIVKPPPKPRPNYNTSVEEPIWFVLVFVIVMVLVFIAFVVARRSRY